MKTSTLVGLSLRGITTILFRRKKPIIGSIIVTDKCNLSCKHCAVSNITSILYPYKQIRSDMDNLYRQGVRILLFYGGEPFLWEDGKWTLKELVLAAKEMGFLIVNVVTNGTLGLDLPEADTILVSLDGGKEVHNDIRGDTYDKILSNIDQAPSDNICLYMAVNSLNKNEIRPVCEVAMEHKNIKAVSFNFHTPYPGTEELSLSIEEKEKCCNQMEELMKQGYPIWNLKSAFPYIVHNTFKTPCHQCVIMENGSQWTCGRCIDITGLCENCGFFFAAELSLVFGGNLRVIFDMLRTYLKYI